MDLDPLSLLGTWDLAREIDDRRSGQLSHVTGTLTLSREGERVRWEESARWHQAAGDVDVRRGLWLVPGDDGWWVRFEDDRPFHPWSPGEEVVHPCAPDTYRGVVAGEGDAWSVRWEVTGPRKDYVMVTRLVRPSHQSQVSPDGRQL